MYQPTAEAPARPSETDVHQLINHTLHSTDTTTDDDVVDLLGAPLRTTVRVVPNTYAAGQIDTVRTLYYPALQAQLYIRSDDTRSFLIQMRLHGSFYSTPDGLQVDMERSAVQQQMGQPHRVEDEVWVYENVSQGAADLRLAWHDKRVRSITYVFYFS
ncbi:MAG: hypothetical protein R6U20_01395 [Longimonas sp.]|uniref:hypothetical protein n=1 Tax=Longimonas sp. TaxID=2039626 RepID=UPI0039771EB0